MFLPVIHLECKLHKYGDEYLSSSAHSHLFPSRSEATASQWKECILKDSVRLADEKPKLEQTILQNLCFFYGVDLFHV